MCYHGAMTKVLELWKDERVMAGERAGGELRKMWVLKVDSFPKHTRKISGISTIELHQCKTWR